MNSVDTPSPVSRGEIIDIIQQFDDEPCAEKEQRAIDTSQALIETQLSLANYWYDKCARQRLRSNFALGYVFGFADAQLQEAGIDEDEELMGGIAIIHTRIFGIDMGPKLIEKSLSLQDDPTFQAGRDSGGKEGLRCHAQPGFAPTGLLGYLKDSTEPS